jgi:hypothetical protein
MSINGQMGARAHLAHDQNDISNADELRRAGALLAALSYSGLARNWPWLLARSQRGIGRVRSVRLQPVIPSRSLARRLIG